MIRILLLICLCLAPLHALGVTLAFETFNHGDVVSGMQINGVSISAFNPNKPFDLAMVFDSTETNTEDPDLEDPWSGGNLASDVFLGNLLIVAEDLVIPDDEGSRNPFAGDLIFELVDFEATSIGFDLVDVESSMAEMGSVTLLLDGVEQGSFTFEDLELFDASIAFGDNTANRISPILLAELPNAVGATFDEVVFRLGGSGAIDNIILTEVDLPEPSAALLLLLGAASFAGTRRRDRRR